VRSQSSCEDLSPGVEECPHLSSLRTEVVRSMKVVTEAGERSGTRKEGNVCRWNPIPNHG
jgi:hypothetical protein